MKIELLVPRTGVGFSQNRGEIIDVSDNEAARMIEKGQAKPVREQKSERAVKKTKAEKASK